MDKFFKAFHLIIWFTCAIGYMMISIAGEALYKDSQPLACTLLDNSKKYQLECYSDKVSSIYYTSEVKCTNIGCIDVYYEDCCVDNIIHLEPDTCINNTTWISFVVFSVMIFASGVAGFTELIIMLRKKKNQTTHSNGYGTLPESV